MKMNANAGEALDDGILIGDMSREVVFCYPIALTADVVKANWMCVACDR
jgi:hypothetical protein